MPVIAVLLFVGKICWQTFACITFLSKAELFPQRYHVRVRDSGEKNKLFR